MQAKIVFRGNKCFREFDLKTVAEKLGLSINDFNHFALAVDEKNEKTVYASVYAQVPLFETQCSAINVSGWLFDRVFNLVDAELPNKEHPDITTMVYAGDTWSEPEEWIAQVNTTIRDENDDSRHIIILNDSNVTPMWMQDDAIQIPTAATKEQLEKRTTISLSEAFLCSLLMMATANTSLSMKTAKPYTQIALKQKNMPCVFSIHIAKA